MNKKMSIKTKALLGNSCIAVTLLAYFLQGTKPIFLLVAGVLCFGVFNIALIVSKRRSDLRG